MSVRLHPRGKEGLWVLDVSAAAGVCPRKVTLNHVTTAVDVDYEKALLEGGVYLVYDLFGFDHALMDPRRYPPSDAVAVEKLVQLATWATSTTCSYPEMSASRSACSRTAAGATPMCSDMWYRWPRRPDSIGKPSIAFSSRTLSASWRCPSTLGGKQ